MNLTFKFGGYHFTPIRKFKKVEGDFYTISRRLRSDHQLGLSTYQWGKTHYSYESFYKASSNSECDIFRCEENGLMYVPAINELFQYTEPLLKEKVRYTR